jgi:hypothetical protein
LNNHFLTTNGTTKDIQGNMSVAQKSKTRKKLLKKLKRSCKKGCLLGCPKMVVNTTFLLCSYERWHIMLNLNLSNQLYCLEYIILRVLFVFHPFPKSHNHKIRLEKDITFAVDTIIYEY